MEVIFIACMEVILLPWNQVFAFMRANMEVVFHFHGGTMEASETPMELKYLPTYSMEVHVYTTI